MTPPAVNSKSAVQLVSGLPQPRKLTFEEYCIYEDETDNCYELVQGYLQLMTSPAGLHIVICDFLMHVFNKLFADTQKQVRAGREVGVRINDNTCRIVDVCVNQEDRWQKISQPGEVGVFLLAQTPLLVVEVTSTNEKEDYESKYQEYASIGISEYWMVNSRREHIRVCTLDTSGSSYIYREFVKGDQIVSQVLPQLELTVDKVLNPPAVRELLELEQARQAAEREALKAKNTTLEAKNATLEAKNATLEAESAAMKQQLEQLKAALQAKGPDFP